MYLTAGLYALFLGMCVAGLIEWRLAKSSARRSMTTRGLVVGKFYPPHRGHKLLIDTALAGVDEVHVIVCDSRARTRRRRSGRRGCARSTRPPASGSSTTATTPTTRPSGRN